MRKLSNATSVKSSASALTERPTSLFLSLVSVSSAIKKWLTERFKRSPTHSTYRAFTTSVPVRIKEDAVGPSDLFSLQSRGLSASEMIRSRNAASYSATFLCQPSGSRKLFGLYSMPGWYLSCMSN